MTSIYQKFFARSKRKSAAVVACLLLAGFLEMVGLGAMLPLFKVVIQSGQQDETVLGRYTLELLSFLGIPAQILPLTGVVVAALILKTLVGFFAQTYADMAANEVSTKFRRELLAKVFNARWGYLVSRKSGTIANALSDEASRAGDAYSAAARLIANSIKSGIYFLVAVLISYKLAIAGLAIGGIMFFGFAWIIRMSRTAGDRQTQATSQLVSHVSDAMGNLKAIKAMDRQDHFVRLFRRSIDSLRAAIRRQVILRQIRTVSTDIVISIMFGAGFFISITFFDVAFTDLIVMALVTGQAATTWRMLQDQLQNLAELESAFIAADRLIGEFEDVAEHRAGTRVPTLATACEFQDVTFAHVEQPVVKHVSFTIPANQITVLQGPSGAGKTTLIDLLLGLYRPDSGRILVDGVDLDEISTAEWRGAIGYVPQELTLLHSTVRENITLGNDAITDAEVYEALELAGARDFV
ncbi:MAG: ABC transporter ATP-binding protein, partial [Bauldia litoralis]